MRKRAGRPGRDDRNFVEAVLWWRRTGAPWRDPVRQHQKLQRQVADIQSFVIELHHAPSVTRLAGCLSHRSTAWAPTWKLIAPARAAARGARVPGTRHKPLTFDRIWEGISADPLC